MLINEEIQCFRVSDNFYMDQKIVLIKLTFSDRCNFTD